MNKTQQYSFPELQDKCSGNWTKIINALSMVDITEAMANPNRHILCHQQHASKNFRVFKDFEQTGGGICTCGSYSDGFALLDYLNGWDRKKAVKEVADFIGHGIRTTTNAKPAVKAPAKTFDVDLSKVQSLRKVWSAGLPLAGSIGERYLRDRGIEGELPSHAEVRFHPNLHYWDEENEQSLGYFPAIISLLRSSASGHPLSIHRIYLDSKAGKAKVPVSKKLMACSIDGSISELGAAIRLYNLDGPYIGITEGVENGTAIRSAHPRLPVWSAYSASVLCNFQPPSTVKGVYIFGDLDASGTGQAAAARLALRLEADGIRAKICLPGRLVSLPANDRGWFTKQANKDVIAERLQKDGYEIVDTLTQDTDWLDVWNDSKDLLLHAMRKPKLR